MEISPTVTVRSIETRKPPSYGLKAHHVGNPPSSFQNPWPSFQKPSLQSLFSARFSNDRNFVPVPSREELVQIRTPDWGNDQSGLKATWIGHASVLVETAKAPGASRGVRVLFDPVFSERTSPLSWFGPKRYTPTPCGLDALPEIDAVVISHNHYDHLDLDTIKKLYARSGENMHLFCALRNKSWFSQTGFHDKHVTELDWWDGVEMKVDDVGSVKIVCTPAQHASGRGIRDQGNTLWSSWVLEEMSPSDNGTNLHKVYFAGDTGYRHVPQLTPPEHENKLPHCPEFANIGEIYGPFDLAFLPIGLYSPRHLLSSVHCAPEETACLHKDVRSKKTIGMHWGTVRGGISGQYEDVREPPRRWKEVCEKAGLVWGQEVGLCEIGETTVVA